MGPLAGLKVVELLGIGPGPFCGMMLGDMGAEIISVERADAPANPGDPLHRNRKRVVINLKTPEGLEVLLKLIDKADVVFEGYRPGVTERLGFGPDVCLKRNPKLVYGRMTGWGQDGPMAKAAGHDINYISLTGALHAIGVKGQKPVPPLNLVGDFGGGGMLLAFGIVCAALEAQRTGKGQVVDATMVDGAAALMAMFIGMKGPGFGSIDEVGGHMLAAGAHYYDTYETKDGKYISVGSLEPQFYELLMKQAELDRSVFAEYGQLMPKDGPHEWPRLKVELAKVIKTKTRDEWSAIMEGTDACVAPVLTMSEAPHHPHIAARKTYIELGGTYQNAPAPRFSRTVLDVPKVQGPMNEGAKEVLAAWGIAEADIKTVVGA
ncbi:MAG: CaiB/BaiF CoA-transferase family protein [Spongiibacteraceae bacterium]